MQPAIALLALALACVEREEKVLLTESVESQAYRAREVERVTRLVENKGIEEKILASFAGATRVDRFSVVPTPERGLYSDEVTYLLSTAKGAVAIHCQVIEHELENSIEKCVAKNMQWVKIPPQQLGRVLSGEDLSDEKAMKAGVSFYDKLLTGWQVYRPEVPLAPVSDQRTRSAAGGQGPGHVPDTASLMPTDAAL